MHSYWLTRVTWLATSNHNALFQNTTCTLLWNFYMRLSPDITGFRFHCKCRSTLQHNFETIWNRLNGGNAFSQNSCRLFFSTGGILVFCQPTSRFTLYRDQCDHNRRFLEVLGCKFSYKRLLWKASFLSKICCGSLLGNYWKSLGYFLFQHLVTLQRVKVTIPFLPLLSTLWQKCVSD